MPAEYAPDGVFGRLAGWLDRNQGRYGFYRPYGSDRGGAGIEPWHLSYAPVAREAVEALIVQIERDGKRMSPPLDPDIVRELRETLGLSARR